MRILFLLNVVSQSLLLHPFLAQIKMCFQLSSCNHEKVILWSRRHMLSPLQTLQYPKYSKQVLKVITSDKPKWKEG